MFLYFRVPNFGKITGLKVVACYVLCKMYGFSSVKEPKRNFIGNHIIDKAIDMTCSCSFHFPVDHEIVCIIAQYFMK